MSGRQQFLEMGDVVRATGYAATTIRTWIATGELSVAAKTARGVHLFTPDDVEKARTKHAQRRGRE